MPILSSKPSTPQLPTQDEFQSLSSPTIQRFSAPDELAREIAIEAGHPIIQPSDLEIAENHLDHLQASGGAAALMTNDLLTERAWLRRMLGEANWQEFEALRSEVIGKQIVEFNDAEQHHMAREHTLAESLVTTSSRVDNIFVNFATQRVERAQHFAVIVCELLSNEPRFQKIGDNHLRAELLSYTTRSIVEPFALFAN